MGLIIVFMPALSRTVFSSAMCLSGDDGQKAVSFNVTNSFHSRINARWIQGCTHQENQRGNLQLSKVMICILTTTVLPRSTATTGSPGSPT